MRFIRFLAVLILSGVFFVGPVLAQGGSLKAAPDLPAPLQTLANEGAQIRYLGNRHGLDGWITIKGGQEQYFYVTEDGEAMLMGLLFNKDGKLITLRQVKALQEQSGDVLDLFAVDAPSESLLQETVKKKTASQFKTSAERLFEDVENSNWIPLGNVKAPVVYSFVDPQCPHCHAFMGDLRDNYIENGLVQLRIIPIGLRPETKAQSAFLLAAPGPQNRWYRHLDGDVKALPVINDINQQAVERNMAIMQSWQLDSTPLSVYRASNGQVKIIQGRAGNIVDLIDDLPRN